MKLGKPLATGFAEERPARTEATRPENRDRSAPRERVRTERPEPAEAPAGR